MYSHCDSKGRSVFLAENILRHSSAAKLLPKYHTQLLSTLNLTFTTTIVLPPHLIDGTGPLACWRLDNLLTGGTFCHSFPSLA